MSGIDTSGCYTQECIVAYNMQVTFTSYKKHIIDIIISTNVTSGGLPYMETCTLVSNLDPPTYTAWVHKNGQLE